MTINATLSPALLERRLDARHQIDQLVLDGRPPSAVAEAALAHLRDALPFRGACALLLDEPITVATVLASAGSWAADLGPGRRLTLVEAGLTPALDRERGEVDEELLATAVDVPAYRVSAAEPLLRLPLAGGRRIFGVLDLAPAPGEPPGLDDLLAVRALCDELAIAVRVAGLLHQTLRARTMAETLARRLMEVQESERRHLAHELHDEVGQELTALSLLLGRIAPADPTSAANIADAGRIVDRLLGHVRDLSLDLRPAMLDDLGLAPALVWLARRLGSRTGLRIDVAHAGLERRPPPELATAAYRIAQEGLTNVVRHAGADAATVRVWRADGRLFVQVEDDGRGFDPAAARDRVGLDGMRERAALLGGTLEVDSAPGRGTRITATLPVPQP